MQVNIVITSKDTNDTKQTTTITYARPGAENAALKSLAQALVALTTNEYISASIVRKSDIDETSESKLEPTLYFSDWTKSGSYVYATIIYNGDGELFYKGSVANAGMYMSDGKLYIDKSEIVLEGFVVTVYATEGESYAAKTLSYEFTGEEG